MNRTNQSQNFETPGVSFSPKEFDDPGSQMPFKNQ